MDRDGTVDVGGGPIPLALLRSMQTYSNRFFFYVVGNQVLKGELGAPGHQGPMPFPETPPLLLRQFPGFDEYLLVDNERERWGDSLAGWTFLSPAQFMERFGGAAA